MERRFYHGKLTPSDFVRALIGEFNRGSLSTRHFGNDQESVVQIYSNKQAKRGGQTALTVTMRKVPDGVMVEIGQQSWLGIAASLGQAAILARWRPWDVLGRLDDLAQDIENLQLPKRVAELIEKTAQSLGAGTELSERLKRLECSYCRTANPVGEPACIACGAPLGDIQPRTCLRCGFVVRKSEMVCPNCGELFLKSLKRSQ